MTKPTSVWIKTGENLVKYKPSGVYFARIRLNGVLHRASLKTTVASVAKLKLAEYKAELKKATPNEMVDGNWTMGEAVDLWETRMNARQDVKESSKVAYRRCLDTMLKSWPEFRQLVPRKVTTDECIQWSKRFNHYSPSVFNASLDIMRQLFAIAMEKGTRANNPALTIAKKPMRQKELHLPSPQQFEQLLTEMGQAGGRFSKDCADLVRFLAYGGFRITEASHVLWSDCDLENRTIRLRVTKNGKARTVPMIQNMKDLLLRLKSECPEATADDPVMFVNECQQALTRAASLVPGMARITHHDLRHLFATRCIESGVDIPTVSRWLGHVDGGVLCMRTYGHLRDHHSANMAAKVSFAATPSVAPAVPGVPV